MGVLGEYADEGGRWPLRGGRSELTAKSLRRARLGAAERHALLGQDLPPWPSRVPAVSVSPLTAARSERMLA
ncbi:hypothetical protein GCM10029978_079440 [Actinoallomurus acanthiterrae]